MKIILFGPPGAGKGTQSYLFKTKKNITHLSTGDMFRFHLSQKTDLGLKVEDFLKKGELVPDDLSLQMLEEEIKKNIKNSFILDGYPRNLKQAHSLEELSKKYEFKIDYAIFLEVPKELLVERISLRRTCEVCKKVYHLKFKPPKRPDECDLCSERLVLRPDDQASVLEKRLKIYEKNALNLKEFYKKNSSLVIQSGQGSPESVFNEISKKLAC